MKKHLLSAFLLFILVFAFEGCSWVNHFYITNNSAKEITVEFQLKDSSNAMPLFYTGNNVHEAYQANKNGGPEHGSLAKFQKIPLENPLHFKITILPNTTLQIGALFNDKYESYKQDFINGRFFNLVSLKITKGDAIMIINSNQFDSHLKKISGDFVIIL